MAYSITFKKGRKRIRISVRTSAEATRLISMKKVEGYDALLIQEADIDIDTDKTPTPPNPNRVFRPR